MLRPKSPVLIISYEMFLRCIEDIRKVKFDLIICDEAHRLKNSAIKTATAITGLSINRRILLTGTPIQNNLQEFYTLAEMANPGIFGKLSLVAFPLDLLSDCMFKNQIENTKLMYCLYS